MTQEAVYGIEQVRTERLVSLAADLAAAAAAADHLAAHHTELMKVLRRHESVETASDELDRSIDALRHLHREVPHLRAARAGRVAVFLPVNLPLYSMVLFAAIPSLTADTVTVRGPAATQQWHRDVLLASGLGTYFRRLELVHLTRRAFVQDYVRRADTVIFTGRPENAEQVRQECPSALFLFEGSGPNPIVVGPGVDLDTSFDRIIAPRLFNSGQDCAGPDAYLVHTSRADEFVARLRDTLSALPHGSYDNPLVRVGPILNQGPLRDLARRLETVANDVVHGGASTYEPHWYSPRSSTVPCPATTSSSNSSRRSSTSCATATPPNSTPSSTTTSTHRTPCTSPSSAKTYHHRCTPPPPSSSARPSWTSSAAMTPTAATDPRRTTSPEGNESLRPPPILISATLARHATDAST
ncbi:aldehyde dehydrogenase family protein [Streptomyces noursei]|uniref:aldehyde dehydrogenase family protein n=1 Tax=Streptomyces noursei TaxID=1971 RepID=UPI00381301F5